MHIPFFSKKKPTNEQLLADLSNTKYDAFVSYKHGDIDSAVAEKLQELLEHFPIPASIDEKQKIQRVFVDTGELSSSSNFVKQVETALENAQWLIVICSPGSRNSEWCKLEVETFLKYHDIHHVLLLMTEGEPEDIFPEKLMDEENASIHILAADARGRNKKEVLKKLKNQAIYKLAAPILGTSYDSLRQRRRTYLFQRIALAAGICMMVLAGFTSYIVWQSIQVKQQYQKALRNQARYMTTVSKQLFESGDRDKALLTNLAIMPENPEDGPVVPEQLYPLTEALASYEGLDKLTPVKSVDIGYYEHTKISRSGKEIYVRYRDKLRVLSVTDGSDLWTLSLGEITSWLAHAGKENWNEESYILEMTCGDENLIFLTLPHYIMALDVAKQQILYAIDRFDSLETSGSDSNYCIEAQNHVLVLTKIGYKRKEICLYDQKSGKEIKTIDVGQWMDSEMFYKLKAFALSEDGSEIALAFEYDWKEFTSHPPIGLARLDLETGKLTILSETTTLNISYYEGKKLVAIFQDSWGSSQELREWYGTHLEDLSLSLFDEENRELFHYELGKENWMNSGYAIGKILHNGETLPVFVFWKGEHMLVINCNTYNILTRMDFHSPVVEVLFDKNDNEGFEVCLESGRILYIIFDDEIFCRKPLGNVNTKASALYRDPDELYWVISGDYKLIFCQAIADPNYHVLSESGPKEAEKKKVSYVNLGEESYRIIHYEKESKDISFAVYSCENQECLFQCQLDDDSHADNICLVKEDEELLAYWLEIKVIKKEDPYLMNEYTWTLHCYDISQGKEVLNQDLNEALSESTQHLHSFYSPKTMAWDNDMKVMACINELHYDTNQAGFTMYGLAENGLEAKGQPIFPELEMDVILWSGDQKHLLLSGKNKAHEDQREYWVYHLPENWQEEMDYSNWQENSQQIQIPQEYATDFNMKYLDLRIVTGETSSLMLICTNNNHNYLLDLAAPDQLVTDNLEGTIRAGFFRDDKYLIFYKEEIIYLYEVESHTIIRQYSMKQWDESLNSSGEIVTDGNPNYFAYDNMGNLWYDPGTDEGIISGPCYIFYIEDDLDIYLYASNRNLVLNLQGEEISKTIDGEVVYTKLYSYEMLVEQAREILGEKELGEEDKKEYFLGE